MSVRRAQDERIEGTPDGLSAITEISDVPDAPTIGAATDAGTGTSVTVAYTAATTGGTATTFTATSTPGTITGTGTSPITVTGLTAGTAYTFKVKGTNSTATGPESAASNSVTPATPLATVGYIGGGYNNTYMTNIEKITFSNDSVSSNGYSLATGAYYRGAHGSIGVAGYWVGGSTSSGYTSAVNKMLVSSGITSTLSATLAFATGEPAGCANDGVAGYTGNGQKSGAYLNSIEKLNYSNDAISTLTATLYDIQTQRSALANTGTAGYFDGGNAANYLNKLGFSAETTSVVSSSFFYNKNSGWAAPMTNGTTAGYFGRSRTANTGTTPQTIAKILFSTDSGSTLSASLTDGINGSTGVSKAGAAGYICGGESPRSTTIDKLTFSTEAKTSLGSALPNGGRNAPAGVSL